MNNDDGFIYYTCKGECGHRKIAALFMPAEIASGNLRCRVCTGEISIKSTMARKPTAASQFHATIDRHYKPAPVVFKRGRLQ